MKKLWLFVWCAALLTLLCACAANTREPRAGGVPQEVYDELQRKYESLFAIKTPGTADASAQAASTFVFTVELAVDTRGTAVCLLSYTGGPEQLTVYFEGGTPMRWDVHYADGAVPLPSVINAVWGSAVLKRGVPYSVQYPSYVYDAATGKAKAVPDSGAWYENRWKRAILSPSALNLRLQRTPGNWCGFKKTVEVAPGVPE